MLTPDFTYSFRQPKDVTGPTFEPLYRQDDQSTAATILDFVLVDLAKDRMLVLSNLTLRARPGAGNTVTSVQLVAFTAARLEFDIARLTPVQAADQDITLNWQGQVFIMGGGANSNLLRARAIFDLGVVPNQMRVGIHGVVIPRANAAAF